MADQTIWQDGGGWWRIGVGAPHDELYCILVRSRSSERLHVFAKHLFEKNHADPKKYEQIAYGAFQTLLAIRDLIRAGEEHECG